SHSIGEPGGRSHECAPADLDRRGNRRRDFCGRRSRPRGRPQSPRTSARYWISRRTISGRVRMNNSFLEVSMNSKRTANLMRRVTHRVLALTTIALSSALRLHAAGAGTLPWERPMTLIATSLTGPVAYAIGLIGIAIAGGTMLWGGELTE